MTLRGHAVTPMESTCLLCLVGGVLPLAEGNGLHPIWASPVEALASPGEAGALEKLDRMVVRLGNYHPWSVGSSAGHPFGGQSKCPNWAFGLPETNWLW